MEVEARRVYTRTIFSVFKEKLKENQLGFIVEIERDIMYKICIDFHPIICNWVPKSYMVEVDKGKEFVLCNCKGFSCEGLLCSHAIKVMLHVHMFHLPSHYILKRWTRDANASVKIPIIERSMSLRETAESKALRFASIKSDLMLLGDIGCETQETFKLLKSIISDAKEKLHHVVSNEAIEVTIRIEEIVTAGNDNISPPPMYFDQPES
jgi:hypothetical protein